MHVKGQDEFNRRISFAGSLVAIGIVFGDIGTSPLYTLNAVFNHRVISELVALGSLSAIFWTLVFQTSIKYVIITLQADNNGEGGIFSLYALIRRYYGKWLIVPAMAGGAFLMADGIITPPISVSSAIEGLDKVWPHINTLPIIVVILIGLFIFQQFGTAKIGKVFGPVMVLWFAFIGGIGIHALSGQWNVLKALNPYYAYKMLVTEPQNFWLLGSIFLCTTGAEALYSDMGHCGRNNIRFTWIFIKLALILSYAGQTAWLLNHAGEHIGGISPFYHIVPDALYWPALVIATLGTIIASQALISGCFTLINEAIRLDIWPKHLVIFPGDIKGQLYIPAINWTLMLGCLGMVFYFEKSTRMEAAFGLSVTLTMLMSTILINFYLHARRVNGFLIVVVTGIFLTIESSFLIANLQKIKEGGWITLFIGAVLLAVMFVWWRGKGIKKKRTPLVALKKLLPKLEQLSQDKSIPKFATNLVYLTASVSQRNIEQNILNSVFYTGIPKRADVYWFVHVNTLDEPYGLKYAVETIARNDVYFIRFNLGFRIEPRLDYYFRQVMNEMVNEGHIDPEACSEPSYQKPGSGDFRFVVMHSYLSYDNDMPAWENFIMKSYFNLKSLCVKEGVSYGLEESNTIIEKYPLVVSPAEPLKLTREN